VIVLADVFPDRLRIVALQRGAEELFRLRAGDLEPEELGRSRVGALVDVDPEA